MYKDCLIIYDGPSSDSEQSGSLFEEEMPLGNMRTYKASQPGDPLTVRLYSNLVNTRAGIIGSVSCSEITAANNAKESSIKVIPNPTASFLSIETDEKEFDGRLISADGEWLKLFQ